MSFHILVRTSSSVNVPPRKTIVLVVSLREIVTTRIHVPSVNAHSRETALSRLDIKFLKCILYDIFEELLWLNVTCKLWQVANRIWAILPVNDDDPVNKKNLK